MPWVREVRWYRKLVFYGGNSSLIVFIGAIEVSDVDISPVSAKVGEFLVKEWRMSVEELNWG